MTTPKRILVEWLCDSAIGFLLIIGGFLLAELIAEPFRDDLSFAYPVGLCIGMVPLMWFAKRRLVVDWDWTEYALFCGFLLVYILITDILKAKGFGPVVKLFSVAIFSACFSVVHSYRRRKLARQPEELS